MIETLCHILKQEIQWEKKIFFLLNGSRCVFFDYFFWLCSCSWVETCIYVSCLWFFLHKKNYKEILLIILSVTLIFLLCDIISSDFFKPIFHRLRPTHYPNFKEQVNVVFGYRGGAYGFISGHTTNAFGFAMLTALILKNYFYTGIILLFACLIGYSRIYLGVHFISDVLAGVFVGLLLGYAVYNLYKLYQVYFLNIEK